MKRQTSVQYVGTYSCFQFLYPSIFTCHTWTWLRFIGMLSSFQTEGHGLAGQTAADELSVVISVHISLSQVLPQLGWSDSSIFCYERSELQFCTFVPWVLHKYLLWKRRCMHEKKDAPSENILLHNATNWFYEWQNCFFLHPRLLHWYSLFIFNPQQKIGKLFLMYVPPSRD